MVVEHTGWLLDLYAGAQTGVALWLLGEDGNRYQLTQPFPITFYAAGPPARLRALWCFLKAQTIALQLKRTRRRDLFQSDLLTVLAIEVSEPGLQPALFERVSQEFPDLVYYDADIHLSLRHAASYNTFPLAHCRFQTGQDGTVSQIQVLDTPWELDPPPPPLRILCIEPDVDPHHAPPAALKVHYGSYSCQFPLEPVRPLLVNLAGILRQFDPDLILTAWGDNWLLPLLLDLSKKWNIPLPLNRDVKRGIAYHAERSYFAYGQVIFRDQQIHLFGRWHVDIHNATLYHDYAMEGIYELARVTGLPLQTVARVSPGSGISAMQMITALQQGILVPWHKQQAERFKSAWDLIHTDQGGLVYQPTIGLHTDVAEIDFVSMYPSIMVHYNISPETVPAGRPEGEQTTYPNPDNQPAGLIPLTLAPLLEKRLALKRRLTNLPAWNPIKRAYKARASAHKWLLVTCFGYLGYKNARFGRIEAHEAVTSHGREALLQAKEAAEDYGFTILHMYVDGLWIQKEGAANQADLQPLLDEITVRTGLPIILEGIYRWVAFLPSRMDKRVPVANRYFGVYQDGTVKARGVEFRRRDTPPWIAEIQHEILERLAQIQTSEQIHQILPEMTARLHRHLADLQAGRVPLEKLVVGQKLSRPVEEYHSLSPAARAVAQLELIDKSLRPGQMARFLYMLGQPGVHAWDLPHRPDSTRLDIERYSILLIRAASTLLQPFGLDESALRKQIFNPSYIPHSPAKALRLFEKIT